MKLFECAIDDFMRILGNRKVARKGGSVAGKARKDLEKKLGESVVSPLNAKELGKRLEKENNKEVEDGTTKS